MPLLSLLIPPPPLASTPFSPGPHSLQQPRASVFLLLLPVSESGTKAPDTSPSVPSLLPCPNTLISPKHSKLSPFPLPFYYCYHYVFGCVESQLQHAGSPLSHVGTVLRHVWVQSRPVACGILAPRPGKNPRPLHWEVDSQPLEQQGRSMPLPLPPGICPRVTLSPAPAVSPEMTLGDPQIPHPHPGRSFLLSRALKPRRLGFRSRLHRFQSV